MSAIVNYNYCFINIKFKRAVYNKCNKYTSINIK